MINNPILEKAVPNVDTLEELYEAFNEDLVFFATFITLKKREIVRQVCIPWVRFRQDPDRDDVIVARNCDCNGEICGNPTQKYMIPKNLLGKYIYKGKGNELNFVFAITIQ